ncbi:hypothetical protein KUTeg_009305 [Tegillarca granosa]|uniref:Carboxylesterase type B domain-containing protein n=1 Tax=Tegillarca granosa TaxID=220873 RepID=A0ABQ9F717_TEGGR|nr:hypothetical protein KUTeg_009305 [Tegillarca granosa]
MSVAYHALSPYNKGLFQRVIAESGSANAPTLTNNVHAEVIEVVRSISECGEPVDTFALVDCLRHKSAEFIINVTYEVVYHFVEKLQFSDICSPVVDDDFLPGLPDDLLKDPTSDSFKMFQSVDFISGVMNGEGSAYIFFIEMMGVNVTEGVSKQMFCDSFTPALSASFFNGSPEAADAMCKNYGLRDGDTNLEAQGTAVADLLGDLIFNFPCVETVDRHTEGNTKTKTYQFVLSRPLPFYLGSPTPWYDKCTHGTDEVYLFDVKKRFQSSLNIEPTPEDLELSKNMIKYWTNFAKTGSHVQDTQKFDFYPAMFQSNGFVHKDFLIKRPVFIILRHPSGKFSLERLVSEFVCHFSPPELRIAVLTASVQLLYLFASKAIAGHGKFLDFSKGNKPRNRETKDSLYVVREKLINDVGRLKFDKVHSCGRKKSTSGLGPKELITSRPEEHNVLSVSTMNILLDPNGEGLPNWPKYDADQKPYIDLNLKITQGTKLFGDRMEFIRNDLKATQHKNDKGRDEL